MIDFKKHLKPKIDEEIENEILEAENDFDKPPLTFEQSSYNTDILNTAKEIQKKEAEGFTVIKTDPYKLLLDLDSKADILWYKYAFPKVLEFFPLREIE